jgi:hypothetical protein
MPHVTPQDVHVNQPLTNMSVAYLQDPNLYVATKFAPVIPSKKQSDVYYTYNKGDLLRNVGKKRAPATESDGSAVRISTADPFLCLERAIHQDIPDEVMANADIPINMKRDASINVAQWLLTGLEIDWATAFFAQSIWGKDLLGVAAGAVEGTSFLRWNVDTSDPVKDIQYARRYVHNATGKMPNKMVISGDVYDALKIHANIIDRIKYGALGGAPVPRGYVNTAILAGLFDLDEVLVADAVYNSAAEGAADIVGAVMSNGCLLGYVNPSPSILSVSAAYTFVWTGLYGAVEGEPRGMGMRILDYPITERHVQRIEGQMPYDLVPICTDVGIFLDKVLTA